MHFADFDAFSWASLLHPKTLVLCCVHFSRSGPYVFMDLGSGVGKLVVQAGKFRNVFWFCNEIVIFVTLLARMLLDARSFFYLFNFVTSKAYLEWPSVQRSVGTEISPRRAKFASQAARLTLTSK